MDIPQQRFDFDKEEQIRLVSALESENIALKLAVEEKDEKIAELDKWVNVLSDLQSTPESENVIQTVK
jgi:hypothetical protein